MTPIKHDWFESDNLSPATPRLKDLFERAAGALQEEDAALASLFERSRKARSEEKLEYFEHPGLTYGVFENTLVYVILKAWLPVARVVWEAPYPDNRAHHADLVIRRAGHKTDEYCFEAKWWHGKQSVPGIGNDVMRLCRPAALQADGRFVLTFWWNYQDNTQKDEGDVRNLAKQHAHHGVRPRYWARFPTQRQGTAGRATEFVMCAFSVDPR